jgi:predicted O-linked N-acetylglucosamine transferase (SPINDLY family)/Flp pilus assembly protein TadD
MKSKFDEALALFQNGQLNKAKDICLEILKAQPNHFDTLRLLGLITFQTKNYLKSVEIFDRAIQVKPNDAEIYNFHAIVLIHLKKFEEAIKSWNCAIKIKPDYVEAYYNRGNAFFELKKIESALASYDKTIQIKPDYAEAHNNRGNALRELEKIESALASYDKAIQIKPDYAEAHNNRGNVFFDLKKIESALASFDRAIQIKPDYAEAYSSRGNVFRKLNKIESALASFDRAIQIKPDYAEAYYSRGNVFFDLKKMESALASYDKAIQIKPDLDYLFGQLFFSRNILCDWSFFKEDLEKLKDKILKFKKASIPFPILSIYDLPSLQKISAETHLKAKYSTIDILEPIIKRESNKKIRIGYYSADFRNHAVSHLLVKLFELHNKSKFELFGFSFGPEKNDEMRKRVSSAFDQFINVNLKSDKEIALLSRDLKIDIAVDLMGFTNNNRFEIFVERCAPIQVSYLGYAATTGSDCIDYIIGDKVVIPKENQKYYSEKIIYLPDCFMANDFTKKISAKIFTREELGLPKEGFVFCSFNNYYKITPKIFDIWMRLLKKVEGSVLWLTGDNFTGAKNLQKEANQRGVDSNRLIFSKAMPLLADHLARHKSADLFIDTIPYNGHTRASDALWAGLPVLALTGQSFSSRVSASLLNAVGLQELITYSEKEYEDLSVELATNPTRLKEIKNKLEKNKLIKPLFNTKLFTKNIESAYTKIYEKYLKNLSVENIEIK